MDTNGLISVIVPVYNVEAYLDRCVQSIVDQTYRNLEIILVDDGSPDRCGAMCDAWAEKDSRVRVIHKVNGGLSDARNTGLAAATGEYIGFVDSDDYIRADMLGLLLEHLQKNDAQIAACGVALVDETGTKKGTLTRAGACVLEKQEAMRAVIEESWLKQPVWNKLYRANAIQDIPFPIGKYHEDVFWTYQAVSRAEKVSVFDAPCYFYTQRENSIMGAAYSLKRLDSLEAKQKRLAYIRENFPELEGTAVKDLRFSCMYAMQMCLRYTKDSERQKIQAAVERIYENLSGEAKLSAKEKIWIGLAKISLIGACRIRNALGIGL